MPTMDRAPDIAIDERDGWIDLKQFKVGQIIEHAEVQRAWMIIDVRENWLKVKPLYQLYEGDPCKHVRVYRYSVDIAFYEGRWRIRRNG